MSKEAFEYWLVLLEVHSFPRGSRAEVLIAERDRLRQLISADEDEEISKMYYEMILWSKRQDRQLLDAQEVIW